MGERLKGRYGRELGRQPLRGWGTNSPVTAASPLHLPPAPPAPWSTGTSVPLVCREKARKACTALLIAPLAPRIPVTHSPAPCPRPQVSGKRALVGSYHVAALRSRGRTLGFDEANAYVAAAWAPGLEEGLLLKHRWRVGDLVAWSNRLVIHTATSTAPYRGKERLHTRIRMRSTPEHAPQAWVE